MSKTQWTYKRLRADQEEVVKETLNRLSAAGYVIVTVSVIGEQVIVIAKKETTED